ncbi:hypothetical protein SSS_04608 [Sarcoptes scabiei]|uniref:Uncharacterized protein n=1 Tax=Sarcoptes scabiei TaxID=52283 RepID=A0A834REP6_SARSC|nr:hypothetical protein SSS_04608 [Sarcoptes scabiei]
MEIYQHCQENSLKLPDRDPLAHCQSLSAPSSPTKSSIFKTENRKSNKHNNNFRPSSIANDDADDGGGGGDGDCSKTNQFNVDGCKSKHLQSQSNMNTTNSGIGSNLNRNNNAIGKNNRSVKFPEDHSIVTGYHEAPDPFAIMDQNDDDQDTDTIIDAYCRSCSKQNIEPLPIVLEQIKV